MQFQFSFPSDSEQEIPYGYCHCGCGQLAPLAKQTVTLTGMVKGQPTRYIRGHSRKGKRKPPPGDTKVCSICQETKLISEFYLRKSGPRAGEYFSRCRPCAVVAVLQSRAKNPNYRKENRLRMRERHVQNRAPITSRNQVNYERRAEKRRESARKARIKNPMRSQAHSTVKRAIKRGVLPPAWTMVCAMCQEAQSADWHHPNGYDEQHLLDVIPLCSECHGKVHRIEDDPILDGTT